MFEALLGSIVWSTAFEAVPAGTASPALGDDAIRDLKTGIRERMEKEHKFDLSTGSSSLDGWHKQGTALVYFGTTAPTTRPDNATSLDSNDYGRMWFNSSESVLYVYTSSGWMSTSAVFSGLRFGVKVLITSGSGNWTVPNGVYKIKVTMCGGGGGGSGCIASDTSTIVAAGSGGSTSFAGATTRPGGAAAGTGAVYPIITAPAAGYSGSLGGMPGAQACFNPNSSCAASFGWGGGGVGYGQGGHGGPCGNVFSFSGSGGEGFMLDARMSEYLEVTPGASLAYSVGAGGSAGSSYGSSYGTSVGVAGSSGVIIIEY